MGFKERYGEPLWTQVRRLPYLVAMGMEGAGRSGLAGSASERHAMVLGMVGGKEDFSENKLITAIVPAGSSPEQMQLHAMEQHDEILDCLKDLEIKDYAGLRKHIARVLDNVVAALSSRESQQSAGEYKTWLLHIAEGVAMAGKEGDFLGFGGERFSENEREFYKELQQAFRKGE
ncbi:hypothetical protein [Robiginitalea marina]|uniref:TerB family tellurite resistance protein n=1 Tax=Robiginitalea marina TaxID=2954105 RepID=A0ABT1AU13_9FLAO|nr:hypothetical protein [Robiginitalea marina]MCO5723490.1 hypothetical protein [Robiginitalea marina]